MRNWQAENAGIVGAACGCEYFLLVRFELWPKCNRMRSTVSSAINLLYALVITNGKSLTDSTMNWSMVIHHDYKIWLLTFVFDAGHVSCGRHHRF